MVEKDLYVPFSKKIKQLKRKNTEVYELKIVKTNRFALSSVHPHQVESLLEALQGRWLRIADQPFMEGGFQQKKPWDCMWVVASGSFVVPVFFVPRKRKQAYLIPINEFLKLQGKSVKEDQLLRFENFPL